MLLKFLSLQWLWRGNGIHTILLLHGGRLNYGGWRTYLTFDFVIVSHQFHTTQYFTDILVRKKTNEKVWELYNKGWGYTKIHHYLVKNNYDVGESRMVVKSMILKKIKRESFLNQPIVVKEFQDFRLEVFKDN